MNHFPSPINHSPLTIPPFTMNHAPHNHSPLTILSRALPP